MRKLRKYQSRAAWDLYRHPRRALYAGLGSGKTAIVLHVLEKLLSEFEASKILIVGTIGICKTVWMQEAQRWDRTRWLEFSFVLGSPKQRLAALEKYAQIYLINYENLSWLMNSEHIKEFDILVLDESSLIKSPSSVRFKGRGKRLNPKWKEGSDLPKWLPPVKGLKHVVANFDRVYTVTGTPKPGEYLDLWSQIYCIDNGVTLGKTITEFRRRYYYQYGQAHYQIKIKGKQEEQEIQRKLKSVVCRIDDKDIAAVIPEISVQDNFVELSGKARRLYRRLEKDFFAFIKGQPITVNNVAVKSNKLQQVCQGAIYDDDRNVIHIHDEKIEVLDALISGLGGEHCIVLYSFKPDLTRLLAYRKAPVLTTKNAGKLEAEWNKGKHSVMYGFPKSMGHGLNLQHGGFHIIFFGLTWSLDLYHQTIGRLRRSGQPNSVVFVHRIVTSNTIEQEFMLPRLAQRDESQRQFLRYFERYRHAKTVPTR